MEGPSLLIQKAVLNGINKGRGGLGSVFVFASGNGASSGDQCNFDGYTNSIYSVTVGAVDFKGLHPYYSEACAANMIVTYSSGSGDHIVRFSLSVNCHLIFCSILPTLARTSALTGMVVHLLLLL